MHVAPSTARRRTGGSLVALAAAGSLLLVGLTGAGALSPAALAAGYAAVVGAAALACLVAGRRRASGGRAWIVLGAGLLLWIPGYTLMTFVYSARDPIPYPSLTDAFWLGSYVFFYATVVVLERDTFRRARPGLWLDGLMSASALAALGAAVAVPAIASRLGGGTAAVATTIAYPLADLVLLGVVVSAYATRRWTTSRPLALLGAGFGTLIVLDLSYVLASAEGIYSPGGLLDALYTAPTALLGGAAWSASAGRAGRRDAGEPAPAAAPTLRVLALPTAFSLLALGLLAAAQYTPVSPVAVALASLTLLLTVVRTVLRFRELRELADVHRLSLTDELTGLGNRRFVFREVERAIERGRREGTPVALMLIDLDGFKELNDTLGHQAGDELLRSAGPRLRAAVPAEAKVARLGGDEFAVLLAQDAEAALETARCIRDALRRPFSVGGIPVHLEASAGVAVFPQDGADGNALLRRADVAMYQAKGSRSGQALYSAEHDRHDVDQLTLVARLRDAIAAGELVLHYQPQVDLLSGRVPAAEALVRWQHPERGLLAPAAFLPAAGQTDLIRELTRWVLGEALRQVAEWRRDGLRLGVAVNLTAADLLDARLPEEIGAMLEAHRVPAEMLEVEVTEGTVLADPARAKEVLCRLRDMGVARALDDFGTGYSSLSHLRRLAVDTVKVDRSFVRDMLEDDEDAAIVRATVNLGHELDLRVIAEGVESARLLAELRGLGCDGAQGYHLSPPLRPGEMADWVGTWEVRRRSEIEPHDPDERRRQSRHVMAGTARWFERVFEATDEPMALATLDGRYLRVNPALCRLLGRTESDLLQLAFRDVMHPDDREASGRDAARRVRGDGAGEPVIRRYVRPDGTVVRAEINPTVVRDGAGRPLHFFTRMRELPAAWEPAAAQERERADGRRVA